MSRQEAFEKIYAKLHDVTPDSLVQYRFCTTDGYRLPQMASHYRVYCETMDSMAGELLDAKRYRWTAIDGNWVARMFGKWRAHTGEYGDSNPTDWFGTREEAIDAGMSIGGQQ